MKRIIISFLLLTVAAISSAQQYSVSLIPKDLLAHASAVVRNEETEVFVEDLDNTQVHFKAAITVLNKNGDDFVHIELEHDKSTIIKNVKGVIYNEFGMQTSKFSEGDFDDVSAWDGISLFTDAKVKHYKPVVTTYPYTVAYEYVLKLKQTLDLPTWKPVADFGISVEKSSYLFICKPDFIIKYRETKLPNKVIIGKDKNGNSTYFWSSVNIKAVKEEAYSPYITNIFGTVFIVPERFSYYGIEGTTKNWEQFGKWQFDKLVSDRQQLTEETIQKVKELTKDISDPKLKAKKIYEYMQSKTHYISVQVGIGGLQPFLASDVDKQNYGDCKALVNYTQALLKAVDIDSYYCVVKSGADYKIDMPENFPGAFGDHIILCIPFKNDTTWADCTNQTIPFGYLGDFTDDRNVLACTPEGGKILHTPKYKTEDNIEDRKAAFEINSAGVISGTMVTNFKGADYIDREYLFNEPQKEQYKMVQKTYPINNMEIDKLDLKQDKGFDPITTETIKLHAADYASFEDGKIYFMLNPANRNKHVPKNEINRVNDVYINRGYTEQDEVVYNLPPHYRYEKQPLDVTIDKSFGKFSASMELKGNVLVYKRKLQLIDGTYPKEKYGDLVDFFQAITDADDYTVSLIKK
jgi:hypothetical protein